MTRNGLFSSFVAVVVAGSFGCGIFLPELQAQGGLPEIFATVRPGGDGRELDPLSTYNKVLEAVRSDYVGDLPKDADRPQATPELLLTYSAINGMLNALDDPYTEFFDPASYKALREQNDGQFVGIGAQLRQEPTKDGYTQIDKPLEDTPALKAGIKRGDVILKVDGKSIQGFKVDQVVRKIRGPEGTPVHLTIRRSGQPKPIELSIVRQFVQFRVLDYEMKEGGVGYIYLKQFNEFSDAKLEDAVRKLDRQGMKALILDLRGNPGGLLDSAIDVVSRFVPGRRKAVVIVQAGGERDERPVVDRKYLGGKWPLVVLVNKTSASASEIVSGAIQDNKAGTVVGATTFGKGLVQTVIPLSGGSAVKITTAKYLTPTGRDINRSKEQRGGVEPDVQVEVTEDQFFKGQDPQLDKALELLHSRIGYHPTAKPNVRAQAPGAPRQ